MSRFNQPGSEFQEQFIDDYETVYWLVENYILIQELIIFFFLCGPKSQYFGLEGHMISVAGIHLCCCSPKATKTIHRQKGVLIKFYLHKQVAGSGPLQGHSVFSGQR